MELLLYDKSNAFKQNASIFCFFMFFALTFLNSNSITFCFTLTWRHTNYDRIKFFPLIQKIIKETKSKYRNIGSNHSEVFYKIDIMALEPLNKCFKNTCEPADFWGKNWCCQNLSQEAFKHLCFKHFKELLMIYRKLTNS